MRPCVFDWTLKPSFSVTDLSENTSPFPPLKVFFLKTLKTTTFVRKFLSVGISYAVSGTVLPVRPSKTTQSPDNTLTNNGKWKWSTFLISVSVVKMCWV